MLSFLFQDPFFLKAILASGKFYIKNVENVWSITKNRDLLAPWLEFSHIRTFLKTDFHIVSLILLKSVFILYSTFFDKTRRGSFSDISFILLLIVLLFHPHQKIFFICALVPFFSIFFFYRSSLDKVEKKIQPLFSRIYSFRDVLLYLFCFCLHFI